VTVTVTVTVTLIGITKPAAVVWIVTVLADRNRPGSVSTEPGTQAASLTVTVTVTVTGYHSIYFSNVFFP